MSLNSEVAVLFQLSGELAHLLLKQFVVSVFRVLFRHLYELSGCLLTSLVDVFAAGRRFLLFAGLLFLAAGAPIARLVRGCRLLGLLVLLLLFFLGGALAAAAAPVDVVNEVVNLHLLHLAGLGISGPAVGVLLVVAARFLALGLLRGAVLRAGCVLREPVVGVGALVRASNAAATAVQIASLFPVLLELVTIIVAVTANCLGLLGLGSLR